MPTACSRCLEAVTNSPASPSVHPKIHDTVVGELAALASVCGASESGSSDARVAEAGAPESGESRRDRLVIQHLSLVRAIAVRVYENLPVHVELDDLVHAGIMGLFDAALKYNDEKQVTFQGYAKHRIKGAILDSLRDMDWASRDLRRRHKQLEAITRELAAVMERSPTEAEIAEKMEIPISTVPQDPKA